MFLLHYNISQEQRKKNSKLQIMKGKMCRVTKVLSYMQWRKKKSLTYKFM